MAKIRTGSSGHTLYLQLGEEPRDGGEDGDLFVGSCITPEAATLVADAAACGLAHHPAILDDFAAAMPPAPLDHPV